jgi:hypothetical protein
VKSTKGLCTVCSTRMTVRSFVVQCKTVHSQTTLDQSTKYVHIKSTRVYIPFSELGLSQSFSRLRVCPSSHCSQNRGGGGHSRAGEGLGESQFRRLEKKLSTSAYSVDQSLQSCTMHIQQEMWKNCFWPPTGWEKKQKRICSLRGSLKETNRIIPIFRKNPLIRQYVYGHDFISCTCCMQSNGYFNFFHKISVLCLKHALK